MLKSSLFFLLLFIVIQTSPLIAQDAIEDLLDAEETEESDVEFLDDLQELLDNPINVNTANLDDLSRIPRITPQISAAIIEYRTANGPFTERVDLLNVPGIDEETYQMMRLFITVKEMKTKEKKPLVFAFRSRIYQKDPAASDADSQELSDLLEDEPLSFYQRAMAQYDERLKFAFLTEKDRGESDIADYLNWSAEANYIRRKIKINLGAYRLQFGQGLIFSPQAGVFKGSEIISGVSKSGNYIKPYTSVNEYSGFFGATVSGQFGSFDYNLFYSNRKLDATPAYFTSRELADYLIKYPQADAVIEAHAVEENSRYYLNIKDLTTQEIELLGNSAYDELSHYSRDHAVLSIDEAGFHRTVSEKSKENQLQETLSGFHLRYHFQLINSLGITAYQSKFDKEIYPKWDDRTYYYFRGDELKGYSVDGNITLKNLNVFGEIGQSMDHGRAWLAGAVLDLDQWKVAVLLRNYDRDYYTFHGYAFADSKGNVDNELGQYLGFRWRLPYRIKWRAYIDLFRHPFRGYTTPIPDNGQEYYSELEIPLPSDMTLTLRTKSKIRGDSIESSKLYPLDKQAFRVQMDWQPEKTYRLRYRYEHVQANSNDLSLNDKGVVMYGDMKLIPNSRLQFYLRLTFFDTESSQVPVYTFENDLPGVLKNVYLSGKGRRWYVLSKWSVWQQRIDFSGKLAQTTNIEPEQHSINIPRNSNQTTTELSFQMDFSF